MHPNEGVSPSLLCHLLPVFVLMISTNNRIEGITCRGDRCFDPNCLKLNIIAWNCRGLGSKAAINSVRDLICRYRPDMMILTETMLSGEKLIAQAKKLQFDKFECVDARGLSGGILVLWNSTVMNITVLGATEQEIHASVKVHISNQTWMITAIYASVELDERMQLWENLKVVADATNGAWVVIGDFNEVGSQEEKKGG